MVAALTPQERAHQLFSKKKPLREEDVIHLVQEEPEAAIAFILLLQARLHPTHAPSSATPPYEKANTAPDPQKKGRRKRGRKKGHPGVRRPVPDAIDRHETCTLDACPDCHGPLSPSTGEHAARTRIVEDIPADLKPMVTEFTCRRYYCPACRKVFTAPVPDALPGSTLGHRVLALSLLWHYGLGLPFSQIVQVLNSHLHFPISMGGLAQMGQRLARVLRPWYEQLCQEIQNTAVLHADETGWRVQGQTHWLWAFVDPTTSVYVIDRSRGSPALQRFFRAGFDGVLVTDFWAAYQSLAASKRQFCLAHLLRELEKVDQTNSSEDWHVFSKKAQRLFRDALRLRHQDGFTPESCESRIDRLHTRLVDLMLTKSADPDVKRLAQRLENYWLELLTFLRNPDVPPTNNLAEREIRPAVVMRKVCQGNQSANGAEAQAILLSLFRTLRRRKLDPLTEIVKALQHFCKEKKLFAFPELSAIG